MNNLLYDTTEPGWYVGCEFINFQAHLRIFEKYEIKDGARRHWLDMPISNRIITYNTNAPAILGPCSTAAACERDLADAVYLLGFVIANAVLEVYPTTAQFTAAYVPYTAWARRKQKVMDSADKALPISGLTQRTPAPDWQGKACFLFAWKPSGEEKESKK